MTFLGQPHTSNRSPLVVLCLLWGLSTLWWVIGVGNTIGAEQSGPTSPYDAKGKRDPFVPLVREGRLIGVSAGGAQLIDASSLILAGILWDPAHQSMALINDKELKVGDTIGGYQVVDIRQDAVVLVRDGKSLVLQLTFEEQGTIQQQRGAGKKSLKGTRR